MSAVEGSAQSPGDTTQVVPPRTKEILHKVAMPPVLAHFGNLPGLGRCLDQTAHYIVDFGLLNLGLRNPEWLADVPTPRNGSGVAYPLHRLARR